MKKIIISILTISFLLIVSGCDTRPQEYEFKGDGSHWTAETLLGKELIKKNGKEFFILRLKYKGDIRELKKLKRLTVTGGTSTSTGIVNLYDKTTKEEYQKQGEYNEEYARNYGIEIMDFSKIQKTQLEIFFPYYKGIEEDILKRGGMLILITSSIDFYEKNSIKDRIDIKGVKIK